jgi:hypothetical protein
MSIIINTNRTASEARLRERIFNVLPAASFQMDRLLRLLDIVESDRSPTACIECAAQPRLHLNPDFIAAYCRDDESLFLLVMHELQHVVLGHTRLFGRATPLHNLVFDAVINAMLSQQFPAPRYTQFFQSLNSWDEFPARLLRPPPGWPDNPAPPPADATRAERRALELLYGNDTSTVTYLDVFNAIVKTLPPHKVARLVGGCVLLGDHDGESLGGIDDKAAINDAGLRQIFRRIVEKWPPPPTPIAGRDEGGDASPWKIPAAKNARADFLAALRKLLRRAGILRPGAADSPRSLRRVPVEHEHWTVLPQARDRRVPTLERILGRRPIFYQGIDIRPRLRLEPREVAHVYLDVSGSMDAVLPLLTGALRAPHRRGEVKLFVFSTVVGEVNPRKPFAEQELPNTGGTEINCVLKHLIAQPAPRTPRRVLLLTDGYTGQPRQDFTDELRRRRVDFFVGLTGPGTSRELEPFAKHLEELPSLD